MRNAICSFLDKNMQITLVMFALSIQPPLSSPYFHDEVRNCAQRVPTQDLLNESEVHFPTQTETRVCTSLF